MYPSASSRSRSQLTQRKLSFGVFRSGNAGRVNKSEPLARAFSSGGLILVYLNQVIALRSKMASFIGKKYKLDKSENFDEYMKELGK